MCKKIENFRKKYSGEFRGNEVKFLKILCINGFRGNSGRSKNWLPEFAGKNIKNSGRRVKWLPENGHTDFFIISKL